MERVDVCVPDLPAVGGELFMAERKGFLEEAGDEGLALLLACAGAKVLPK